MTQIRLLFSTMLFLLLITVGCGNHKDNTSNTQKKNEYSVQHTPNVCQETSQKIKNPEKKETPSPVKTEKPGEKETSPSIKKTKEIKVTFIDVSPAR